MNEIGDFFFGFVKPLRDMLISITIYALTVTLKSMQSAFSEISPNSGSGFVINIWYFLAIFSIVGIAIEIVLGIRKGYSQPPNAATCISGVIVGTVIFWSLLSAAYLNMGGTKLDAVISGAIAIMSMIVGILLKIGLEGNKQDTYPY
jgi:hypothetical protein